MACQALPAHIRARMRRLGVLAVDITAGRAVQLGDR
jgi:hypothetical protein